MGHMKLSSRGDIGCVNKSFTLISEKIEKLRIKCIRPFKENRVDLAQSKAQSYRMLVLVVGT